MFWRSKWKDELEASNAAEILRKGSPGNFPLSQIQALTNTHILTSPLGTSIPPCSPAADEAILDELQPLKGRLRVYESGLLACLHAMSPNEARRRVCELMPYTDFPDEHYDDRVAIYLQFLVLARKARELACDEAESRAALELFVLLRRVKRDGLVNMPTVWGVLRASAQREVDVLFPLGLIKAILRRCSYAKYFQQEVRQLQASYEWSELYSLVARAADLLEHPHILSLVLPPSEFSGLLTWKPDTRRIDLWASKSHIIRQHDVAPILKLEGPDTTGRQCHTFRHSNTGDYINLVTVPQHEGIAMLDAMLEAFDRALMTGPAAVQAIASTFCHEPHLKTYNMLRDALGPERQLPHLRSHRFSPESSADMPQSDLELSPSYHTSLSSTDTQKWLEKPLDLDRATLRYKLQHELRNVPLSLIKTCIEQSKSQSQDGFVRHLNDLLMDHNDQVCVNVANFLGDRRRREQDQVDGCWIRLLMHMMREQPVGMMDRCGETLLWETWSSWVSNLSVLYGEDHFSPTKGLGFTKEGFDKWTQQKRKPSRSVSSRTMPASRVDRHAPGMQSLRSHRDPRLTHRSVSTPSDGGVAGLATLLRPDDSPSSR